MKKTQEESKRLRLKLSRETLQQLTAEHLNAVRGGVPKFVPGTTDLCGSYVPCD